jgi:hypothetical protein
VESSLKPKQTSPKHAFNVVVVKQHMPWDGLNGGRTRC